MNRGELTFELFDGQDVSIFKQQVEDCVQKMSLFNFYHFCRMGMKRSSVKRRYVSCTCMSDVKLQSTAASGNMFLKLLKDRMMIMSMRNHQNED